MLALGLMPRVGCGLELTTVRTTTTQREGIEMKIRKLIKLTVIGLIALVVTAGLAACSSESTSAQPAAAAPQAEASVAVPTATVAAVPVPQAVAVTSTSIPGLEPTSTKVTAVMPDPVPTATAEPETKVDPIQMPDDIAAKVDEYISAYVDQDRFSGAVLVAQRGEILFSKGYGMADYEQGVPNTPTTKFSLGQISRAFTIMAIMQLQEKGLLLVDDPISKYLPDYPDGDRFALHHLMITTSGIPSYALLPEFAELSTSPTTPAELIDLFKNLPLDNEPGQNVNFSGSGYVLLGQVIEKVSGMSYEEYIEENIFGPLGMSDSGYDINRPGVADRAYGYLTIGENPLREESIDMSNGYSAAGLYSSLEDLHKWDRALYTEELVSRSTMNDYFSSYKKLFGITLGYGSTLIRLSDHEAITRFGAIGGIAASYVRFPDDEIVFIVLTNNSATSIGYQGLSKSLTYDLTMMILERPYHAPEVPEQLELSPEYLDAYVGRYQARTNQVRLYNMRSGFELSNSFARSLLANITREDGALFVDFEGSGLPRTQIFPESKRKFFAKGTDLQITFNITDLGGVIGLFIQFDNDDLFDYAKKRN